MNRHFRRSLFFASGIPLLLLLPACGKKAAATVAVAQQKQPVEVVAVQRRDLTDMLSVVGSLAANESAQIRPEIAGQVRAVMFNEGDRVTKGQPLIVLEAMKMEMTLTAAMDGTIAAVRCAVGDMVQERADLVDFAAEA